MITNFCTLKEEKNEQLAAAIYICGDEDGQDNEKYITNRVLATLDFASANDIAIRDIIGIKSKEYEILKFQKMIKSFENGDFDFLLTYGVKDLAVDGREWPFFLFHIQLHSIPVVSMLKPFGLGDPDTESTLKTLQEYHNFLLRMEAGHVVNKAAFSAKQGPKSNIPTTLEEMIKKAGQIAETQELS